jgi:hypothetical protein
MIKKFAMALVVCSFAGSMMGAPLYKVEIIADYDAGTWECYASDQHYPTVDNYGIASYGVTINGVLTIENMGPAAYYDQTIPFPATYDMGAFTKFRSGPDVSPLAGSQDAPDTNDPAYNGDLVYGMGQYGGDLAALYPSATRFVQQVYGAPLLLAAGTWDGEAYDAETNPDPVTLGQTNIVVFKTDVDDTVMGSDEELDVTYVPEPATVGLLAVGGLLALVRRRRS